MATCNEFSEPKENLTMTRRLLKYGLKYWRLEWQTLSHRRELVRNIGPEQQPQTRQEFARNMNVEISRYRGAI